MKDFANESAATLSIDIINTNTHYLKVLGDESRKNRLLLLDLLLLFLPSSSLIHRDIKYISMLVPFYRL